MPFFDDSGVRTENHQGPLWGAFAIFASQLERLIVLNIAWALTLVPFGVSVMLDLPAVLRVALLGLTLLTLPPLTAVLYRLVKCACLGETVDLPLAREVLAELALPGLRIIAPLLGLIGLLLWLVGLANQAGWMLPSALLQVLLLLTLTASNYWFPLAAENPSHSALRVLTDSAALVWHYPAQSLILSVAVGLALFLGAISIGGLFLAIPVLVALLQTQMLLHLRLPIQKHR